LLKITHLDLSNTPLKEIGATFDLHGANKSLQTVKLPDTVIDIDPGTFSRCEKLTDINLPASLKELGNGAFRDCTELYNLTIPDSLTAVHFYKVFRDGVYEEVDWEGVYDGGHFKGCGKLPLATRSRLNALGYKGQF
jgi:hypothetical protein